MKTEKPLLSNDRKNKAPVSRGFAIIDKQPLIALSYFISAKLKTLTKQLAASS